MKKLTPLFLGVFAFAFPLFANASTAFDSWTTSHATPTTGDGRTPMNMTWGASGTVAYIQEYIAGYYFSTDRQIQVKLYNSGTGLDCQSATGKYANADYGIPLSPSGVGSAVLVTFTVSGTQCAITSGSATYFLLDTPAGPYTHWTDGLGMGDGTNSWYAVYDSSNNPSGPPPPTGDLNEVLNYIPATGVSTSTGITNVGVNFSIAHPDWITYFGYRIYAPNGSVVYNATSTAPVAGQYTLSTAFNFTQKGNYAGHAYFAQQVGSTTSNVWETDGATIQQILVGVTQWTVDANGVFAQNQATTSTTTIPNLNIDCGSGFSGSVCNLAATLLIPSGSAVSGLENAWGLMLTHSPFNFFTDSRNLLIAFAAGSTTAANGGTFSLNLYGKDIPIISTTTAATVGVGSTQLSFLKFLTATGLWVLVAWYIYWRIASIFGV